MAVLSDIHGAVPDPAEQKVSGGGAQNDGHKQPHVIRHDDQHEQVGDGHLKHVQQGLQNVLLVQDLLSNGLLVRAKVLLAAVLVLRQLLQLVRIVVHLLAQVLEPLVGHGRQEDQDGHADKGARLGNHPGIEQDVLAVAAVELKGRGT